MNPSFNMSMVIAVISIICVGHFSQTADAFARLHRRSTSTANEVNDNVDNEHNNNNNNDNHITIDLPVSPSIQSPTQITLTRDNDHNEQFQTLHSNSNPVEETDSTHEDTDTISREDSHVRHSNPNLNRHSHNNHRNNNNNNNNNILPSFPSYVQSIENTGFDTLFTNQAAVVVPTLPSNAQIDSALRSLPHLIQRQRDRQRRIQSFRQALLRRTRPGHAGHAVRVGYRVDINRVTNMAHARRLALQALRRRMGTY